MDAAGKILVDTLDHDDEDLRTMAAMLLTRAGTRAEPLLAEALDQGRHVPAVITILASIGDPLSVPRIEPFTESTDPDIATAAQEAIALITPTVP